jgi:hypothetical protein
MSVPMEILFGALVILAYLVAPVSLIYGWVCWRQSPGCRTVASRLSFVGFLLASASGILAVVVVLCSWASIVNEYDLIVRRTVLLGGFLSLAGVLFAIGGLWRRSALRWFAPAGAVSTLAFWVMMTFFP